MYTSRLASRRTSPTWFWLLLALVLGAASLGLGQSSTPAEAQAADQSDSLESHLGRGYSDLKSDRYEDAVREFRAALALDPKLVMRARFPLAVALFESRKPEEARQEFEAVRAAIGDRADVLYYLGRLDLMQGNLDAAIRNLTRAVDNPPFPDAAFYLGSAFLKKGELAPAEKWLQAAAKLSPRDPHVQEQLGLLYQQAGRKQEAETALALAAELRQRDAEVSQQRIDCAAKLERGPLEAARPVCDKLFDPDDAGKLTMLGTLYGQHGDYAEALEPLRRAAELSPNSPQMQYNLALACFRLERYDEARTALAGAVKLWPDLFPLNALEGVVLYRLGEDSAAYQTLSHAHELNPRDAATAGFLYEVSIVLAQRSLADKQAAESLDYSKTAARLRPDDPEPHRLMADVYSLTGQQEQALEERRKVDVLQH